VFVVHATARLLAKLGPPAAGEAPTSTTSLGAWYANVVRWRSPVALFVNEVTLLPVLLPLAPARTLCERFSGALAAILGERGSCAREFRDRPAVPPGAALPGRPDPAAPHARRTAL